LKRFLLDLDFASFGKTRRKVKGRRRPGDAVVGQGKDMVFLAHALLGPSDRGMMITREGLHPVLVVGGALAQNFLAHHWNAEHVMEEVHHLLGPRQGAEIIVNDNAVEAVVTNARRLPNSLVNKPFYIEENETTFTINWKGALSHRERRIRLHGSRNRAACQDPRLSNPQTNSEGMMLKISNIFG
jgi:hypothetical protein